MKEKKRAFAIPLLLAAICLLLCACGDGDSSGAPADGPAGTPAAGVRPSKGMDEEEYAATEKRLKEVRIFAEGAEQGSFVYTYGVGGNPARLEVTGGLPELLNRRLFNYEYDAEGRLSSVKFTDDYGYANGFIFQYSQENGITRTIVHPDENGDGVLNEEEKPLPALFEFTFDADGYMLSYKNVNFGMVTGAKWTYDEAHRVTEEKENSKYSSTLITYSYDDKGNLTEECHYSFDDAEFLWGILAGAGLEPDKSEAAYFQREAYDDLQFNDEGLLTAKNGGLWNPDGYDGDTSIVYAYDNEKNLRLEKLSWSTYNSFMEPEGTFETAVYHSANDVCRVEYYKSTYKSSAEEYSSCKILSDQFAFWGSLTSAIYPTTDFYLPYGGSIRYIPPEEYSSLHDCFISMFPGMDCQA